MNQPQELYTTFSDAINGNATQRIFRLVANATQNNVTKIHMFFHSTGGNVGDGVALYNFFKVSPVPIVLYNPGIVASIAFVSYLGAVGRKCSANAIFGYHRSRYQPSSPAQASTLEAMAGGARSEDARTETIIKAVTNIPKKTWEDININDVYISAQEALKYGICDEIADFSPPLGTMIYMV
jgi:ATP-dependent Clp protease, protease subunit